MDLARKMSITPARALVTGGMGQDGWYLTKLLLEKGYEVHAQARALPHVGTHHQGVIWHVGNIADPAFLRHLVRNTKPDEIYNLAAISRPQLSWDQSLETADVNALVPHILCELLRLEMPSTRLFQASSSEIFGRSKRALQDEGTPCIPDNPYAVAKEYAHRMAGAYRARYGLHLSTGILFNHESPRRPLSFVSQKIAHGVALIALGVRDRSDLDEHGLPILHDGKIHLGNIDAKRDFGFAGDYVEAMHAIVRHPVPDDFIIGTGTTHSIAEFCEEAFAVIGQDWRDHVVSRPDLLRASDKNTCADPSKLKSVLGWSFKTSFPELVAMMVQARIDFVKDARISTKFG